jgi:hypothetical protein
MTGVRAHRGAAMPCLPAVRTPLLGMHLALQARGATPDRGEVVLIKR